MLLRTVFISKKLMSALAGLWLLIFLILSVNYHCEKASFDLLPENYGNQMAFHSSAHNKQYSYLKISQNPNYAGKSYDCQKTIDADEDLTRTDISLSHNKKRKPEINTSQKWQETISLFTISKSGKIENYKTISLYLKTRRLRI